MKPMPLARGFQRLASGLAALSGLRRAMVAMGCGALVAFGLPPLDLWLALIPAFTILVLLLDGAHARGRGGFWFGWCFGFGYFGLGLHWIGAAFLIDPDQYLWLMVPSVLAIAALPAFYWGAALWLARRFWPEGSLSRILFLAGLMTLAELARGRLFTGFPWGSLGLIAGGIPGIAQSASLIGMTGLVFPLVAWSALPALFLNRARPPGRVDKSVALALALAAPVLLVWGLLRLQMPMDMVPGVSVRLVQPNIDQALKISGESAEEIFGGLLALSQPAAEDGTITAIIWPESSVPFFLEENAGARNAIGAVLADRDVLMAGAVRRTGAAGQGNTAPDGENLYNSVLLYDAAGHPLGTYDKWRLVPGGEYLPLAWALRPLGLDVMVTVPGIFEPGSGPHTLALPGLPPAGFLICYEITYPDYLTEPQARPQWLVNVTNDGWFGRSTGPWQHLAQAQMRAIEQGLPIARAANTGISAMIDPWGRLVATQPLATRGALSTGLPRARAPTLYARIGDLAALMIALASVGFAIVRNFQKH